MCTGSCPSGSVTPEGERLERRDHKLQSRRLPSLYTVLFWLRSPFTISHDQSGIAGGAGDAMAEWICVPKFAGASRSIGRIVRMMLRPIISSPGRSRDDSGHGIAYARWTDQSRLAIDLGAA